MEFATFIGRNAEESGLKFGDLDKDMREAKTPQDINSINERFEKEFGQDMLGNYKYKVYFEGDQAVLRGPRSVAEPGGQKINTKTINSLKGGSFDENAVGSDGSKGGAWAFDYENLLRESKVPEDVIKNLKDNKAIDAVNKSYNTSDPYKTLTDMERTKRTRPDGKATSTPWSRDRYNIEREKDDALRKAADAQNGKNKIGKWVVTFFGAGVFIGGGVGLYEAIEKHRRELNGCWLYNTTTGQRCKIYPLTCNKIYKDANASSLCDYCEKSGCPGDQFNPCMTKSKALSTDKTADFPGTYDVDKGTCTNCVDDKGQDACVDNCILEDDGATAYSKQCNGDLFDLPAGWKILGYNLDWGQAFESATGVKPAFDPYADEGLGIWGTFKLILIIAGSVIALAIVIKIISLFWK